MNTAPSRFYVILFFCLILVGRYIFFQSDLLYAASPPSLSISPSIISIDLATDQPQATITYKNNGEKPLQIHLSAKDFSVIDDLGRFNLLEGQDARNYHYSLSSWIHFDSTDFTLEPHEEKTVQISIDTQKVTIGGHYASLLTEILTPQTSSTIAIRSIAATVLFLRTGTGHEREEGRLNQVTIPQTFFSFPDHATVRFQNTGNVQVIPHGYIQISDLFGNIVAKGIVNDASSYTLPETVRKYDISFSQFQTFVFPGWYRSDIFVHFGQKDKKISEEKYLVTTGSIPLLPSVLGIILFVFLMKRYSKKLHHFILTVFKSRSKISKI